MNGNRWRQLGMAAGFLCALALILAVTVQVILRRTAWISLPEESAASGTDTASPVGESGALSSVAVTPQTVQAAIATLSRPESYSRTIHITQFWEGGSGSYEAAVAVSGPWTRVDLDLPGGTVRHVLTNGETTFLWYGAEPAARSLPAGSITADDEQPIPTYEDVLALPRESIVEADFRLLREERCIYVEAEAGEAHLSRYWISVESGLLVSAETWEMGELIYQMEAEALRTPEETAFLLPDGADVRAIEPESP